MRAGAAARVSSRRDMDELTELLHLLARWVHLIAGIMWIGNSMLFNWLDRNLEPPPGESPKKGLVGTIWMVHSGAFYEVEKKFLQPSQMPKVLHWFKWQNGITWLSGIALLVLVYYMGGAALMTDPMVSSLGPYESIGLGVGTIVVGWIAYDVIWRSPIGRNPVVGLVVSIGVVTALSAVFFLYLSGRAAYMHVGVLLGTLMTGNVWMVIVPSQRELVKATVEGREQDPKIGYQAKQRSIHNNYMTFPLLFIMLSNHFPSTFGHTWNWLVLLVLTVGSAVIRHMMNIRFEYRRWLLPTLAVFFGSCAATWWLIAHPTGLDEAQAPVVAVTRPVSVDEALGIVQRRCVSCHAEHPTNTSFPTPPLGLVLETPDQVQRFAARIRLRVCTLRNMPLGNMTEMTEEERAVLAGWIDQGAPTR
jgi:uncharacterized membrane protein